MKKYIVRSDIPKDPALIIKNQLILGPGIWNGKKFTAEQIKKGISLTDWADIQRRAIVYGHRVDGDASPDEWLGYHSIPEYRESTKEYPEGMYADLYFYDENLARKIAYGGAKAGVSERLKYSDMFDGVDIHGFINLSVVDNPACKLAYLNLSDEGGIHTAEIMSPQYINLSEYQEEKEEEEENKIIENSYDSSSENKLDDNDNYIIERRLSDAKTEEIEVVNTENLSDKKENMEDNQTKEDSNEQKSAQVVDDKFNELEKKIAELEKKLQEDKEKTIVSQPHNETVVKPTEEPKTSNSIEITSSSQNSNKEVIDALNEMKENMNKVITENTRINTEVQKVANPQSVARTSPNMDISSRDDDVVTKLVKQYEAMHNIDNE